MATVTFRDGAGVEWMVWRVVPGQHAVTSSRVTTLPEELADGWLCFESVAGKRRVYPVPPDWETLSPAHLEILCRAGVPVAPKQPRAPSPERSPSLDAPSAPSPAQ
jgi:hypothetical protein